MAKKYLLQLNPTPSLLLGSDYCHCLRVQSRKAKLIPSFITSSPSVSFSPFSPSFQQLQPHPDIIMLSSKSVSHRMQQRYNNHRAFYDKSQPFSAPVVYHHRDKKPSSRRRRPKSQRKYKNKLNNKIILRNRKLD